MPLAESEGVVRRQAIYPGSLGHLMTTTGRERAKKVTENDDNNTKTDEKDVS